MGKRLRCCCGCCLTLEQLPTTVTITPEEGDPVVLSGSWAENGECCYRFTSNPVAIPGLTVLDYCLEAAVFERTSICHMEYYYLDYFSIATGNCTGTFPTYTYTKGGSFVETKYDRHKTYFVYKTYLGVITIDLCHTEVSCESYEPACKWTVKTTISNPYTVGDNRNRLFWFRHLDQYNFDSVKTQDPTYSCSPISWDEVSKSQTGDDYCSGSLIYPTTSTATSSSRSVNVEDRPDTIEFPPGTEGPCVPVDDEEEYTVPDTACLYEQMIVEEDQVCTPPVAGPEPPAPTLQAQRYTFGGEYYYCAPHPVFGSVSVGPIPGLDDCPYLTSGTLWSELSESCYKPYGDEIVIVRSAFTLDFTWP